METIPSLGEQQSKLEAIFIHTPTNAPRFYKKAIEDSGKVGGGYFRPIE